MSAIVLFLWLPFADDVSLSDLLRFPSQYTATIQIQRYQQYAEFLRWAARHHAEPSQLLAWAEQCQEIAGAWKLLENAHETWMDEDWRLAELLRFRRQIGEDNYRRGAGPPELPEGTPRVPRGMASCPPG